MRNPTTPLDSVIQSYLLYCQHLKARTRQGYAQQLAFFVKWLRANGYPATDAVLRAIGKQALPPPARAALEAAR